MRLLNRAGLYAGVAAGVCAGALALAATASAGVGGTDVGFPESRLVIDASGPFVQGKAFSLFVTGANGVSGPNGDLVGYDLAIYLLAAKVSTCPMVQQGMVPLIKHHPRDTEILFGGQLVPEVGAGSLDGPFTTPVFKATAGQFTGPMYICGYSLRGIADAAWYEFGPVTIKPRPGGPKNGSMVSGGSKGGGGAAAQPKPEATASPSVTRSGNKLVCSRGRWSGAPTSYSYKWEVTGVRGAAGLGRTLAVTPGMRGHEAQCSVTATGSNGSTTATSRPVKID